MKNKSRVRRVFYDPHVEIRREKVICVTNQIYERKRANDWQGLREYVSSLSPQERKLVVDELEALLPLLKKPASD